MRRHRSLHYRIIRVMFWAFPYLLWLASEQSLVGPAASLLTQGSDDKLLPAEKKIPLFSLIAGYRYRSQALLSEDAAPSSPNEIELLDQPEELTGLPGTRVPHLWVERKGQRVSMVGSSCSPVLLAGPGARQHQGRQLPLG